VLPPIVVDLGPDIRASELALVLGACNEVVSDGECLASPAEGADAPRAIAVARPREQDAERVDIEVRLLGVDQPALLRELHFTSKDPVRERWRSVGFAIATLVGEGQRAAEEEKSAAAEPARAAAEPTLVPAEPASAAPPAPAPAASVAPPPVLVVPAPVRSASAPAAVPEPAGVFLGLALLSGPALDDGSWRFGAGLRAAWASASGWMLIGSASYSARALGSEDFTLSWLCLEAGAGYRHWFSERLGASISVQAGVQQLHFEAVSEGVLQSRDVYNPALTLGLESSWWPWRAFGFWAALDVHSIGRRSELFVADTLAARSFPVELTGMLGIGWAIR
jgi:hypothetical protein